MLRSQDQFRPGPPPELSSDEWAAGYNEVKLVGQDTYQDRTAEQAAIARFWTSNAPVQYNTAFAQIARDKGLSAVQTARLFATGGLVAADISIACWDAKYAYLFWRPRLAIQGGEGDGNPDTVGDPNWLPFLGTPNHPEYPAGHGCVTSAMAEVFAAFLSTNRIDLDIISTVPNVQARHYEFAYNLKQEIIDARVWAGFHYRESVLKGVILGRKVAHWTLKRYFLPVE
jgi:hypothetical protein